ncbi:MAG: hypothetical protein LBS72_05995 [Oscillospiraceae bacterium]|jgi:ABC-2 type transport system permease protein|nr:hypothetical protein [Oscillospiraceae bacterium]
MQKYGILFKEQLCQRFGLVAWKSELRSASPGALKRLLVALLVVISLAAAEGFYVWFIHWFARTLISARLGGALLFFGLFATMLSTLVMGTVMLLSVLYFNRDAEALVALPISPRTVFAVKTSLVYLGECAVSIPLIWPVFIIYGIFERVGAIFYIKSIIVWLCAMSLPLLLSSLVTLPLMRWSALWKRRDMIAVVGGIVLLMLYMAGQMWLTSRIANMIDASLLISFIMGKLNLFNRIARIIPPLGLSMNALTQTGAGAWGNLAALIGLSALLFAIALRLSDRIYQAGVIAQMESHQTHRAISWNRVRFVLRSPRMTIFFRDLRILLRTPIYALNSLALMVVYSIILLLPLSGSLMASDPEMESMVKFLYSLTDRWTVALILAGVFALLSTSANLVASTAQSREGKQFFWARVVPVTYESQAEGKLLLSLAYAWLISLLMAICGLVGLKLSLATVAMGFCLSVPLAVPSCALQLSVDILKPKLNWSNPTEAVKQNMNMLIGMLICAAYITLMTLICILCIRWGVRASLLYAMIWVVAIALCVGSTTLLRKAARIGYARVET